MSAQRSARRRSVGKFPAELPPARTIAVRAADGTKLHTQVFGPADGYPIVLAHGITCAIGVWGQQIADLSVDHRVIAYDHRGHGRSGVPKRGGYSLTHLASDLDSVLEATLAPGSVRSSPDIRWAAWRSVPGRTATGTECTNVPMR